MTYDRDLAFTYRNPTKIIFGENTVGEVGIEVEELGCSRAFLVTDPGVIEAGLTERVAKALGNKLVGTFDACCQDSGLHIINEAAGQAIENGADVLVSIGGGSVIDTAKAMTILLASGGEIRDYSGFQTLSEAQAPHIAIPTTAGTGAEVTYVAVVKDWDESQKMLIGSNYIIPSTAILDPTLTVGLPPMLTATTGMDAMSHAVEAMHALLMAEPIADGMALHAIRLINENLPVCVENGDDLVARGQQLVASTMASIAWGNAQVALAHSIAHTLGGLFEVPHGLANSIVLPHVMKFNMEEVADRYRLVAQAMGVDTGGMSDMEAAEAAAGAMWDLTKKIGVPQKLRETAVPEDRLAEAAEMAVSDGTIINNARPVFEPEEVLELLKLAW